MHVEDFNLCFLNFSSTLVYTRHVDNGDCLAIEVPPAISLAYEISFRKLLSPFPVRLEHTNLCASLQ